MRTYNHRRVVRHTISCVVAYCGKIEAQNRSLSASKELQSKLSCLLLRGWSPENYSTNNNISYQVQRRYDMGNYHARSVIPG